MDWNWIYSLQPGMTNSLSAWTWLAMGLFFTLYVLYFTRGWLVAQRLRTHMRGFLWKSPLRLAYFAMVVMALLGPSFGKKAMQEREVKAEGKDIFFCVDLSKSMDADDVSPTRIGKVRFELKKVLEAFPSDRVGLIIFSGDAFLQSPLTFDKGALTLFIESLNTGLVPTPGTDFAPPLSMALEEHLKESKDGKRVKKRSSKVIILISDGEDFSEETASVAGEIADSQIKLFALGVGTEQGAKLRQGYGFKRDPSTGEPVVTALNSSGLKKVAEETGGRYFEISDGRNDINRLINEIASIKGETIDARRLPDPNANKYLYLLIPAFFLICIDALLTVKTVKI